MVPKEFQKLEGEAKELRKKILKLAIKSKDGHIAPSFSTIEILVALYIEILKESDKFILSKGHGCLGLYAILRRKGFNPKISGHPDIEPEQGIICTTGSLGHGLPIGVGMALAKKLKKEKGRIFVLLGDGECEEGTIWESLNLARKFKLDNLIIIVDHNKLQALDFISNIMGKENIIKKLETFGCHTKEINGHNFAEILPSLSETPKIGKPLAIIAHTTKGKGLSFMENKAEWHSRIPEGELLEKAYKELGMVNK